LGLEMQQTNLTVANAPLPATYEAAKKALAACANIDECQDWANKAEAMASYARMAKDETLRKMADRIQGRAVRRLGDLLKLYDGRGNNQHGEGALPTQKEAAAAAEISEHQRKQAVRVSNVPQAEFEAALEADEPATVTKLAEMGKVSQAPRQIDPSASIALATLEKFADFCSKNNPSFVATAVRPAFISEMRKKVGSIDSWLDQFIVDISA
jgi:hypothetical protein